MVSGKCFDILGEVMRDERKMRDFGFKDGDQIFILISKR